MQKIKKLIQLSSFITLLTLTTASTVMSDTLVATGSQLANVDAETGEISTLIASAGKAIFYDSAAEKIYYGGSDGSLRIADRNGSNASILIANTGGAVADIVVDKVNSQIIWTDPDNAEIKASDLNGGNIGALLSGYSFPQGIVLDKDNAKIYWAQLGIIGSADLDGNNFNPIHLDMGSAQYYGLTQVGNFLYFTNNTAGQIEKININGTGHAVVLTGLSQPTGLSYSEAEDRLYFISGNFLKSVGLTGQNLVSHTGQAGFDILANFFTSSNNAPAPIAPTPTGTPEATPVTTPAPEETPSFTRMYFSLRSDTVESNNQVIWMSMYREEKPYITYGNVYSPRALGYSLKENQLYIVDRYFNDSVISKFNAVDRSRSFPEFSVTYFYDSIIVDDDNQKLFLSDVVGDLATWTKSPAGLFQLFKDVNKNTPKGFALYENELFWGIGQEIYSIDASYNPRKGRKFKSIKSHVTPTKAIATTDFGPVFLINSGGRDYLIHHLIPSKGPFAALDLGERGYSYSRVAFQHLDPKKYEVPYAYYLSSGNKVDVLLFGPEPRILPFARFSEDVEVTGIVEVPVDGAATPLYTFGKQEIYGKVDFLDFATGKSANRVSASATSNAGIQVNLVKVSDGNLKIGQSSQSTTTGSDGSYRFKNLEEGATYKLTFTKEDLEISSSSVNVIAGEEAPPVFVSPKDLSSLGCSTKAPSTKAIAANRKNQAVEKYAISIAAKALKKAKGKQANQIKAAAKKVDDVFAGILKASNELPLVQVSCNAQTTCTAVNAKTAARTYQTKTKAQGKAAKALINKVSKGKPELKAQLAKIQKLTDAAVAATKQLPTQSFSCKTGPQESTAVN